MAEYHFDLAIIGSGPGGYIAAIRASQLGMKVAVIERDQLGGICLNWGCIPTKALLKSAEVYHLLKKSEDFGVSAAQVSFDFEKVIRRSRRIAARLSKGVEYLFKQNNITVFNGHGKLRSSDEVTINEDSIRAGRIMIATGARPRSLPDVNIDGTKIISSREAMTLERVPKSMIIIGAGAIGVEFAYFYHTFGCQVTIVEMMPDILPIEDSEITQMLLNTFKKQKMSVHTRSTVKGVSVHESDVRVTIASGDEERTLEAEIALVAIGVQGNYEELGLETTGIEINKSWIKVDENYQTSTKNIYAIGDIIGPPWLAHVASAEGIYTVEKMAGLNPPRIDYDNIPGCTYSQPQVASIGMTENKAILGGYKVKIGRFPFQANGKSLALGESQGMVKLIFNADSEELLGAHIIHAEATELINELSVVKNSRMKAHSLIKSIHAHPTLSEAIVEAAAAAFGEAIHI